MQQFLKFCIIGGCGFVVDSLAFYGLLQLNIDSLAARLMAFWVAAFSTWLGNRFYTFSHSNQERGSWQWLKHFLSVHLSGSINLSCFYLLTDLVSLPIAFCCGIIVGTGSNYILASKVVFVATSNQPD